MDGLIDGYSTNALITAHIQWLIPIAIGLYRSIRRPTDRRLEVWMSSRGLDPRGEERTIIEPHLYRSRWFRTAGFSIGWSVVYVDMWITRSAYGMATGQIILAVVGYCLGAVLAELARQTPTSGVAAIEPRRIEWYSQDFGFFQPKYLALVPVGLAAIWHFSSPGSAVEPIPYWLIGLSAPASVALLSAIRHFLVSRPQRVETDWEIRADDALRASAVHALVGCEFVAVASAWATLGFRLVDTQSPILDGPVGTVVGVTSMLVGVTVPTLLWGFIADNLKWVVPRARQTVS